MSHHTFVDTVRAWRAEQKTLSTRPTSSALDLVHLVDRGIAYHGTQAALDFPELVAAVRDARKAQRDWDRYGSHNAMVTLKAAEQALDEAIRAADREAARVRARRQAEAEQASLFGVPA